MKIKDLKAIIEKHEKFGNSHRPSEEETVDFWLDGDLVKIEDISTCVRGCGCSDGLVINLKTENKDGE